MIVRFDTSALNDEASFEFLDKIFQVLEDGRHQWSVFDESTVNSSKWFDGHGQRWKKRILTLLDCAKPVMTSTRSVPTIVVGSNASITTNECVVGPSDAWLLLKMPLRLVVEDSQCDGAFLRALLLRFGENRLERKLGNEEWNTLKQNWTPESPGDGIFFQIFHAGGSRVGDIIKQQWEASTAPVIAIVDSDRCSPSDSATTPRTGSTWHSAVEKATQTTTSLLGLQPIVHALPRREMENYIPEAALKVHYPNSPQKMCVRFIGQMSVQQRHFYDMKRGFRDSLNNMPATGDMPPPPDWAWKNSGQQNLYDALTDDFKKNLFQGLGRDVWKCWQQGDQTINRKSMRDEAEQDLNQLVNSILEYL